MRTPPGTARLAAEITLGQCFAGHFGDQICATPLARLLTVAYGMRVYASNKLSNLVAFANNPYITGFREGPGIRLDRRMRGAGHLIQRLQRGFGLRVEGDPRPELYLSKNERRWSLMQRAKWPKNRPVCILSTHAVSDWNRYSGVDWDTIGRAWARFCTVVQPILTRPPIYRPGAVSHSGDPTWQPDVPVTGAIVYRDLSFRRYLSLFSVADYFCGPTSGGTHLAAAFGVPALVILWEELLHELRVPRGTLKINKMFLYPQHDFFDARPPKNHDTNASALEASIARLCCRRSGAATKIGHRPRVGYAAIPARKVIRTPKGRVVCVPDSLNATFTAADARTVDCMGHASARLCTPLCGEAQMQSRRSLETRHGGDSL